ncbi:hypothetical protein CsSME_00024224 [Camellia sinensis var. sinensis]
MNTAVLVTCIRNFRKNRGPVSDIRNFRKLISAQLYPPLTLQLSFSCSQSSPSSSASPPFSSSAKSHLPLPPAKTKKKLGTSESSTRI